MIRTKHTGFTLVEMVVVLAISSILISLAAPSFQTMVDKNRVDTVTNELANALFYVRSEALKRRMDVILCVSNASGSDCETVEPFDYANGWLIYMDCDGNGELGGETDVNELTCTDGTNNMAELLKVHEKLDTHLTVTGNSSYTENIGYSMNGRIKGIGGSLTVDLLSINNAGVSAKKVVVANSGRIRTAVVSP